MTIQTEYLFDELQIPEFGCGMLLYGRAILKDNGDGDFYVSDVKLDGNPGWISRPRNVGPLSFAQEICAAVVAVLEDQKTKAGEHAALEWADAVNERQPVGHNAASRLEYAL